MNPLLKLDALITADQPADASVSVYEDIIASITPSTVRFPDFLDYACTISSFTHSELLFNIVLGYIPGVSKQLANELDDDEAESLMDEVDQETRAKGHRELNHALTYCRKKLKSQSRSMNCPIMNTLMSVCIACSGLSDEVGLTLALAELEPTVGHIPIYELETFDDDVNDPNATDFATASFLRIVSFIMVFFDTDMLRRFLDKLTVKNSNNAYDLENLWISHSKQMSRWFNKNNVELLVSLTHFFEEQSLMDTPYPLKMTAYFQKIPAAAE